MQFWCRIGFFVHFLLHKISKVLKLSAINKYHLTWSIYTSHSFLKIKNLIVSKLLKKVLPSDTIILVIWSVKYHFTKVMTTNLETIFDFFSKDTLCNISDTKFSNTVKAIFRCWCYTILKQIQINNNGSTFVYQDCKHEDCYIIPHLVLYLE